ncbi:MAG TPA: M1 family metallopeptidase [Bacteroidales bacterium]|nr:M1 family metallopeptidase [Bacteroidales bacterium]HPS73685.1 M1 family metallopeptidase [Bacteroidales bacterium]
MKKSGSVSRLLTLTGLSLLLSATAWSQVKTVTYVDDPNKTPPDRIIALHHVDASLSFKPEEKRVMGEATLTFTPNRYHTDSIVVQTPDFTLSKVTMEDIPCRYILRGSSLVIYPPVDLKKGVPSSVFLKYESSPRTGPIYFIGWMPEEKGKRKQIWAHRPNGWLPYLDDRVTMDLKITFDKTFTVFANGERVSVKDNPDGTKTWHYRMAKDHPYFSTCLAIGDYEYAVSKTNRDVPLELLYYRGMKDRVAPTYQYTEKMFEFYEKEMGVPYPYPVYRELPVSDYMYGGMETTTATVFGDYMLIDPRAYWQRNYINVNAHELAHQWYGDCIAHLENKDVWLTESFGTYFAKMFEKSIFGVDQYQNEMNNERIQALSAAERNNFPVGGSQGGVERIYQKGSLVLGMLRYVMGDREFLDAVKLYTERWLFKYAETNDFMRAVYDATGKSYNWFFDEWILRGGEPAYQVRYTEKDGMNGQRATVFTVTQVHDTSNLVGLFRMPVVFEVHYTDGTFGKDTVWISEKEQEVSIPNPEKKTIAFTLFDPGRNILKKVTFLKSVEELTAQALQAENMIDRYDAMVALRDVPVDVKRPALVQAYFRENFHLVKSEIIRQLAGDNTPESVALLLAAVKDRDANVRKAAITNANPIPGILREAFEGCLSDSSYLNVELALDALCRDFSSDRSRYLEMTKNETGWRGKNIRMKWLEIAIGSGEKKRLTELISYTGPSQEFETRMNSLRVLRKLNYLDPAVIDNAVTASLHWNNKLSTAAREMLKSFFQEEKWHDMIVQTIDGMQLSEKDRSTIDKVLKPIK